MENIQIKNITQTIGGRIVIVPYDPSMASLVSNGQIVCFGVNTTAPRLLLHRTLRSLTTSSSVNVDYVISDPTPAILSMNTTDFSETLASDPAIVDLAIVLGSSGVTADAPPELAFAAAAPSSAPPSGSGAGGGDILTSQNAIPVIVGAVAGAAVVSALVATGLFLVLNKARGPAVTAQKSDPVYKQSSAVVIIESTTNPMASATTAAVPSTRSAFDPQGVRAIGARV
jgi:hypothetical protein